MKKTLFATTLVLALSLTAAAAQKKLSPSQHLAGNPDTSREAPPGIPKPVPSLCSPSCLFYGGDLNISDPNAAGLSDENTILIPGSSTYAAYNVPSGVTVGVTGILFNVQTDVAFDPNTASWDIRTGVSEGNGGTSVASGTGTVSVAATGNNFIGLNEYTVLVRFATVTLGAGEYWFNVLPQCTNGATDGSCSVGRIFVSNTTQDMNGKNAHAQPNGSAFLNSSFFGFTWANWCDSSLGLNSQQCRAVSFGLTGTAHHD